VIQGLLVVALAVALMIATRRSRRSGAWSGPSAPFVRSLSPAVVTGLAMLVRNAFASGLLIFAAQWRHHPHHAVVSGSVHRAAFAVFVGLLVAVAAVVVLCVGPRMSASLISGAVIRGYGRSGPTGAPLDSAAQLWVLPRRARIAKSWATGRMVDGAFAAAAVVVASTAAYFVTLLPSATWWQSMAGLSTWLVASGIAALLGFTYGALADRDRRKFLGVLWDVATFWPRGAHPSSAPCYAERAVPDLVCRIEALAGPAPKDDTFPYHSREWSSSVTAKAR
jgi:hypothetical protein